MSTINYQLTEAYHQRSLKELARTPSKRREHIERFVFDEAPGMGSTPESGKIEQMTVIQNFIRSVLVTIE
jgi:hypothetical protein